MRKSRSRRGMKGCGREVRNEEGRLDSEKKEKKTPPACCQHFATNSTRSLSPCRSSALFSKEKRERVCFFPGSALRRLGHSKVTTVTLGRRHYRRSRAATGLGFFSLPFFFWGVFLEFEVISSVSHFIFSFPSSSSSPCPSLTQGWLLS